MNQFALKVAIALYRSREMATRGFVLLDGSKLKKRASGETKQRANNTVEKNNFSQERCEEPVLGL